MTLKEKLDKIKFLFADVPPGTPADVKCVNAKLADGTAIQIAGDTITEGAAVTTADGNPLPDGDYQFDDGSAFSVAAGIISKLTQPQTGMEQLAADLKNVKEQLKVLKDAGLDVKLAEESKNIKAFEDEIKSILENYDKQAQAMKSLIEMVEFIANEPKEPASSKVQHPFAGNKKDKEDRMSLIAAALEEQRKSKN